MKLCFLLLGSVATAEKLSSVDNIHKPLYHLEASLENVCYETTYIDEHYSENGFALGILCIRQPQNCFRLGKLVLQSCVLLFFS